MGSRSRPRPSSDYDSTPAEGLEPLILLSAHHSPPLTTLPARRSPPPPSPRVVVASRRFFFSFLSLSSSVTSCYPPLEKFLRIFGYVSSCVCVYTRASMYVCVRSLIDWPAQHWPEEERECSRELWRSRHQSTWKLMPSYLLLVELFNLYTCLCISLFV